MTKLVATPVDEKAKPAGEIADKKPSKKGAFTLTVPLTRDENGAKATFELRDLDEDTYLVVSNLLSKENKGFDAIRLMVKELWVAGDPPEVLNGNFIAVNAASKVLLQLIVPMEAELKKN